MTAIIHHPKEPSVPTTPAFVASARAVIEATVLAALAALATALSDVDWGDLGPWSPIAFLVIRQAEGFVDQRIDPTKQRGPLGGAPHPGE